MEGKPTNISKVKKEMKPTMKKNKSGSNQKKEKKMMEKKMTKAQKDKKLQNNMRKKLNETCPPGQIFRRGYNRPAYQKEDGTKVKSARVPGSCVANKGKPGHGTPIVRNVENTNRGLLSSLGYSLQKSKEERQMILRKAMLLIPPLKVLHHVNYIRTLHKSNKNQENYKKLDEDMIFIRQEYQKMKQEIEKVIQKVNTQKMKKMKGGANGNKSREMNGNESRENGNESRENEW